MVMHALYVFCNLFCSLHASCVPRVYDRSVLVYLFCMGFKFMGVDVLGAWS
ncbi:hypothetical protein M758_1G265000 [Ceratodon purpureus]|uniref:Uncharacterized protein n=1 Tax=Ceratodon purpureus TaxID=3225 RepID=A0A8T0JB17_CERPU|nr:hypothetical protein KC19_1G272800 [Ceratodon purpureus]KAG0631595.1 hypothetical protein M758_1G265000 [Ceratodon purpureus]